MSDFEENTAEGEARELFPGDKGTLPEQVRRVLVGLLRNSYISYERNAEIWPHLMDNRSRVKSFLNDLFLELYVDERNDIAYALPVDGDGESFPKLKRERQLTDIQSLLVVFLRQQYLSQISSGAESAWVDGDEMREHLDRLFSEGVVNHARSRSTVDNAIEYMRKCGYIEAVRGASDRFRILPIIETAFPLEKIIVILEAYEKAASSDGQPNLEGGE